jgi:SNF2 family DNA or RNA helicase
MEKTLLSTLETGEEVEAVSAAALANKLLQFANGAAYYDEHKNWAEVHKEKLDALEEIVEENPSENILVAYNYKFDLARLLKRFPQAKVLDNEDSTIERWNRGEIPMLLAHPASAGHGINLQKGGSLSVWFGLNWSLELYQQFNARLHRQGQTKPVRIIHLVSEGTIDERVLRVLKDKDATQSSLLNALKA